MSKSKLLTHLACGIFLYQSVYSLSFFFSNLTEKTLVVSGVISIWTVILPAFVKFILSLVLLLIGMNVFAKNLLQKEHKELRVLTISFLILMGTEFINFISPMFLDLVWQSYRENLILYSDFLQEHRLLYSTTENLPYIIHSFAFVVIVYIWIKKLSPTN